MKLSAKWELSCSIWHFFCKKFTCGSYGPVFLYAALHLLQKRLLYHYFFKKCTRTSFWVKSQGMAQMQLWKQICGEIQDRNVVCMCSEQCSEHMFFIQYEDCKVIGNSPKILEWVICGNFIYVKLFIACREQTHTCFWEKIPNLLLHTDIA